MNRLPDIGQVSDLRLGDHPGFDAWFYAFARKTTSNTASTPAASPARSSSFMVAMDNGRCTRRVQRTFRELAASLPPQFFRRVRSRYIAAWLHHRVVRYERTARSAAT
ncbi:MAG: hypothetical protein ACLR0N_19445 [Bilophila wadsworthia]